MKDLEFTRGTTIYEILDKLGVIITKDVNVIDLPDSRFIYFDTYKCKDYKKMRMSVGLPMDDPETFSLKHMYFDLAAVDSYNNYVSIVDEWSDKYGMKTIELWNDNVGKLLNLELLKDKI